MNKNIKSLVSLLIILLAVLTAFLIFKSTASADSYNTRSRKLYGTIKDSKTKKILPIASVEVKSLKTGTVKKVPVSKKGTYSIKLKPGNYTTKITAKDYLDMSLSTVVKPRVNKKQHVLLKKEQFGTILGSVTYPDDQPVIASQIQIYQLSKTNIYNIYPVNGKFSLGNLKPGIYDVKAISFSPKQQEVKHAINVVGDLNSTVNFVFKKELDGIISGSVKYNDGSAIENSQVQLYQNGIKINETYSNNFGNYGFKNLKPGIYDIEAKIYSPNQTIVKHTIKVESEKYSFTDFVFKKAQEVKKGSISGSVTWADQSAVRGCQIHIFNGPNSQILETYTDVNGSYTINNLELGVYDIKAIVHYPTQFQITHDVRVEANGNTQTNFNFKNVNGVIAGIVNWDNGQNVTEGVKVEIWRTGSTNDAYQTLYSTNGYYEFTNLSGIYDVKVKILNTGQTQTQHAIYIGNPQRIPVNFVFKK